VDLDDIIFGSEIDLRHSAPDIMKVALAQINATVGDLAGNARLVAAAARQAHAQGATVVLAPELALAGYPAEDLLLRPAFMQGCAQALADLAAELADCSGLHVVVGHPHQFGERGDVRSKSLAVQQRFNAASVLTGGRVVGTYLQARTAQLPGLRRTALLRVRPRCGSAAAGL
jgi:NAD+ synthase (glutamine-hydrolysing)